MSHVVYLKLYKSSVQMTILPPNALIDPDLCTLVPHLKVKVNGP